MTTPTSIRLEPELQRRVDRVARALAARSAGLETGRSRVLKLLVARGLRALEAELSLEGVQDAEPVE